MVEIQHPIARDPVVDRPGTILVDGAIIICSISSVYSICLACIHTTIGDGHLEMEMELEIGNWKWSSNRDMVVKFSSLLAKFASIAIR